MSSEVVVVGDAELVERLRAMRERARANEPALEEWGDMLATQTAEAFATQGASLAVPGTPWKPLKPKYLAWKLSKGYRPEILQRTGAMMSDVDHRPMAIDEIGPMSATFGTARPYAKYHQSRRPRHLIPYRPFLVVTPLLKQQLDRLVAKWVTDGEIG